MEGRKRAMGELIVSMVLFGTIGVFVRSIPLSSAAIAAVRGLVGALALTAAALLRRGSLSLSGIGRALPLLLLSGACLGGNWLLLFQSYRYTTVAAATTCYYLAPVLVVLASPLVLGETLTLRRFLCCLVAFGGAALVCAGGTGGIAGGRGILLALGAACLYAGVMLLNKTISGIPALHRTALQLAVAGIMLLPFCAASPIPLADPFTLLLLLVVGIVHTGLTYLLYFDAMEHLTAQTVSVLSYLDPVVAVACSAALLHEPLTLPALAGSAVVLLSAFASERPVAP